LQLSAVKSRCLLARLFHEVVSRDLEDDRATGRTIAECGSRLADLRIRIEGMSLMNHLCVYSVTMFDSISELSECIRDNFSIYDYKSEIRSPKSEI